MERASSSSPEAPPGFRIERRLGRDTFEATQEGLERRVVLRRLAPGTGFEASAWPERPGVVPLYAVTGDYVATRLLPGARSLAECRTARPARRRRWLAEAAAALDGSVHGRLSDRDILIDRTGRVWVTGFGQAPPGATAEDDRAALRRLHPPPRDRRLIAMAVLVVLAGAVTAGLALRSGGAEAPAVPEGAVAVGSALAPGDADSVDCEGDEPSGNSNPCTLLQLDLAGRPLEAPFDGIVRRWSVRGARGRLALQILRPAGDGYRIHNRSRIVTARDGVSVFRSDRSVPRGARFALEVTPGAAVGVRRGVERAQTGRFFDPLRDEPPRTPDRAGGDREELLLRVDVVRRRG